MFISRPIFCKKSFVFVDRNLLKIHFNLSSFKCFCWKFRWIQAIQS